MAGGAVLPEPGRKPGKIANIKVVAAQATTQTHTKLGEPDNLPHRKWNVKITPS